MPGGHRVNCRQFPRSSQLGRSSPVGTSGELPSRSAAQPVLGYPGRDLGTGVHLQPAPDVLHVRLGCPRRDGQAAGDGLIGQPPGDQPGHLELTAGQPRPRARGLAEEAEDRIQDRWPVAVVEQVARTRQRIGATSGISAATSLPPPEPGAPVRLAVQHRRPRPDRRERPDVGAVRRIRIVKRQAGALQNVTSRAGLRRRCHSACAQLDRQWAIRMIVHGAHQRAGAPRAAAGPWPSSAGSSGSRGPAGCRARGEPGAAPPTGPFFLGRLALAGGVA